MFWRIFMQIIFEKGFSLKSTIESGQCFRFMETDGGYNLKMGGRSVFVTQTGNTVNITGSDDEAFFENYFGLDLDYAKINKILSKDAVIARAIKTVGGIHILKQEIFETLISFIISQNNNIPRIKKIIAALCDNFGEGSFPDAATLARLSETDLSVIKAGFRAKYILDAARKTESGEVDIYNLKGMDYDAAAAELKKIKGVGDKVASCVLLFGAQFYDAFPIDVWIKKALAHFYPQGIELEKFGGYAGVAQQYLFHYARTIGLVL